MINTEKMFGLLIMTIFCATCFGLASQLYYQENAPWFKDISTDAKDPQSDAIIAWLNAQGGWGYGRLQIDFSIKVLQADETTPFKVFIPNEDFYEDECDFLPVPVPINGSLEGETGYACVNNGDCHLIVFHRPTRILYEMWRANIVNQTFSGGCLSAWDLKKPYAPKGRGEQCTSADAAGLLITPLLFTADELALGEINHAIRFILPNARIRNRTYVRPATHATSDASGGVNAPPYGTRLRLRQDFPLSTLPTEGARTVARAMQHYGIILADGGNIALTAQDDQQSIAKWENLLGSRDLQSIMVTDFEMVNGGERFSWNGNCILNNTISEIKKGISSKTDESYHSLSTMNSLHDISNYRGQVEIFSINGTRLASFQSGQNNNKLAITLTRIPKGMYVIKWANSSLHFVSDLR